MRGRLGKGGFAVVHRVYDNTLKKEVAMKAVKLPKDEGTRMRLLREVDVLHAVRGYADAHAIPGRNKARLRGQGAEACAERLRRCYGVDSDFSDDASDR